MSSIGSFNFIKMTGPQIPTLASMIRPINRPGVDGEIFREEAQKVEDITLKTVAMVTNSADAQNAVDNYKSLQGYNVTITDDNERIVQNVMVLQVYGVMVAPLLASVPAGYTHRITANWVVKPTQ